MTPAPAPAPRRVLVTGAGGYIGGAIARSLAMAGDEVHGAVRRQPGPPAAGPRDIAWVVTGDLADARLDLRGFSAVLHAAGLGHRRNLPPQFWRRANVDPAVNLARQARAAGVDRFVLISTAYVHGRSSDLPVGDRAALRPMDDYAASKLQAEREVAAVFGDAGLTVLRPVAVIGPNCPGNLQFLVKALRRGVPLPFGGIGNRRAFIGIGDLARLVVALLASPAPPPALLAAHPRPIATPELIRALAAGLGVRPRLPRLPRRLLAAAAALAGRADSWASLSGDFAADPQAALSLGWTPDLDLPERLEIIGRQWR